MLCHITYDLWFYFWAHFNHPLYTQHGVLCNADWLICSRVAWYGRCLCIVSEFPSIVHTLDTHLRNQGQMHIDDETNANLKS